MTNYVKLTCTQFSPQPKPVKVEKKKPAPIKKLSDKRAKENKEYLTLRKVFLENHPLCVVKMDGCTNASTEIHHSHKRTGSLLTEVKYFVAICRNCHIKVENENIKF